MKKMITSATQPVMLNLVFIQLVAACPHIGEVVICGIYFLPFLFHLLTLLLTCPDCIIRCRNVVNAQKTCF